MKLFLDTNVLLGYTFKIDDWNSQSLHVIDSEFEKYSSYNVKREFEKKYRDKVQIANSELDEIFIKIRRKSNIDTKKVISILNKHYLQPSITYLWEADLSTRDRDALLSKLREIKRGCDFELIKNKSTIQRCITFVDRGEKRYDEIYQKLIENGLMWANFSDGYIVIDAHHVGLTITEGNLYLVTGDKQDIVNRKESIVEFTSIHDIIYLGDFHIYLEV
ncbi:hypothetical protein [Methanosarcina barkeri]|uniref:DUF4935 domain-containing protein n=1 Tax=Methanosarcina barkeri CM1 TaxID=796385 RepID=A0A0G3CHA6_METBA|nr:hypothetical protein [Methanosarcina barkeri]AKJ39293.1 hypothetical protein MCM1_2276 [Methanosarcina barkeri CM1]